MPRSYTTPTGLTLHFSRQLGRGQFGIANAVRTRSGDMYCIKDIPIKVSDEAEKQKALTEVKMMKDTCKHHNIVTFYESWFERNRLCILMEYAPNGSLDKLIQKCAASGSFLAPTKVMHFVEELASALDHCHNTLHIIHRDIKPGNILIDELGSLKLTDFGLSKSLGPTNDLATTFCGSPLYMAPEQMSTGERYSFPADMWALGCVLYEIMALASPWASGGSEPRSFPALVYRIMNTPPDYASLAQRYSTRIIDTTRWMLQRNVMKRATAADIVSLLEMRAPPSLSETIHPYAAPPPSPLHHDDYDAMVATVVATPPTPPPPSRADDDMKRRKDIVADAQRLIDAASSIQRSFRVSQQRRKMPLPPVGAPPAPHPLKPFDRETRIHKGIVPKESRRADDESATIIQTALRASLNRRRRDVSRARPPPPPHSDVPRPRTVPPVLPRLPGTGGGGVGSDPVKCSARLQALATPRVHRQRPVVLPAVRRRIPPAEPRPAWI